MSGRRLIGCCALLVAAAIAARTVRAQVAENPRDPFGIAIPYPFVHLVHSEDASKPGTTGYLRAHDPYLLYQLGRDLVNRQFELRHGVLGRSAELTVPLYVGIARNLASVHGGSPRFARDHAVSCGMCHSSVYREPSAGQTIGSTGGLGRNTGHFYGAGLVEMIGEQVTRAILGEFDLNHNGVIDRSEANGPHPVRIRPAPAMPPIDYGDLSPGADGVPRLNNVFRLWYVDAQGAVIADAFSLADPRVAAYGFAMQPFGWGRGRVTIDGRRVSQGGEASTLREFYTTAADFHMGLQAYDPTQQGSNPKVSGFGGLARVSLNGAQQYDFGGSVDLGHTLSPGGISLDDPDNDGHPSELTEGDVDAAEFFLLHAPAPASMVTDRSPGPALLRQAQCTQCHVENWRIEARDPARGLTGDRRMFRFEARAERAADGTASLVGHLTPSMDRAEPSGARTAHGGETVAAGIYSDFKHWDIGSGFYERRFDGSVQTEHRTAPLWGVGNTGPYGHSGQFRDLRSAILAHGGAAAASRAAFVALGAQKQDALLAFLKSLILYQTDEIPADIDGDGAVAADFLVNGMSVGYERFAAPLLFATKPRFQSVGTFVHPNGRDLPALLMTNVNEVFGLTLEYRVDTDGDGFPDCLGPWTMPDPKGRR